MKLMKDDERLRHVGHTLSSFVQSDVCVDAWVEDLKAIDVLTTTAT